MSDRMQELVGTKEKSTRDQAFNQAEHAKNQAQGVKWDPQVSSVSEAWAKACLAQLLDR